MRDKRFIAEHRCGLLTEENHKQLILWACKCVENVFPSSISKVDERLINSILTEKKWAKDCASVGDARNASIDAIAVANELIKRLEITIAQAVAHAVTTAHMADHSLRAAEYALKAIKLSGKLIDDERKFQDKCLSFDITELVLSARKKTNE